MKTLYLIRHAKSSWKNDELTDFERPLNERGKRDAPFMGKLLHEQKIRPDAIISSPALRALTTARIIATELKYDLKYIATDGLLYEADFRSMMSVVNGIDDSLATVIIVGHNPGITFLANSLTEAAIENIPTCGVVGINLDGGRWRTIHPGSATLKFFEQPKKYFK